MLLQQTVPLSNGLLIPRLGFGTWMIDDDKAADAVKTALAIGYRHIDTAQAYQNEEGVGQGIKDSGIAREDIFVTTKLAAEIKSYEEAVAAIDESLAKLGLEYVDLMIIHSPKPWAKFHDDEHFFEGNKQAWRALEEAYDAGKLKSIGVSNFEQVDIDNILESASVQPMINQILVHIGNTPHELIDYSQSKGIVVEAYSPIGHGELTKNESLQKMAEAYDVSVPQLAIRYTLQLGLVSLPKATGEDHIRANTEVDFEISDEDMETLKHIDNLDDYGEANAMPVFGKKRA